jgi:hypothetical protein
MAESYKRLGTINAIDDREKLFYIAPADTQTLISNITVTNLSSQDTTIDINVYESGITQQSDLNDAFTSQFIVGGRNSAQGYSTDGINWVNITLPINDSYGHWQFDFGNGKILGILDSNDYPVIATSVDALAWTTSTLSYYPTGVAFGNGKFVILAGQYSLVSTDAVSWTTGTLNYGYENLSFVNGFFAATSFWGATPGVVFSTNGTTWTPTTLPFNNMISEVAYGNGVYVAVRGYRTSTTTDIAAYSTDLITWTSTTLSAIQGWMGVAYGNGKFVAVAYGNPSSNQTNQISISTDAITWTAATISSVSRWLDITNDGEKFVAVASGTTASYSTDGITWTSTSVQGNSERTIASERSLKKFNSDASKRLYNDLKIQANDTKVLEPGIALESGSSIVIKNNSGGNLIFSAFGVELS